MKKYFLLFLIIIFLFGNWGCFFPVNKEKTRTATGKLENILGTFKLSSGIEGKLLTWKDSKTPQKWNEEVIPSPIWLVYPGEMISERMIGRKLKMTYQITETIPCGQMEFVVLIKIKEVKVLDKKK